MCSKPGHSGRQQQRCEPWQHWLSCSQRSGRPSSTKALHSLAVKHLLQPRIVPINFLLQMSLSHVSEATRRPDKKTWMNLPLSKAVCCREERGDKPVGIWIINVTAALDTQSDNAQKVSNMNWNPLEPIPLINHRLSISFSYNYQGISIKHTFNYFIILITIFLMYSEFSSFICDHWILTEVEGCAYLYVCVYACISMYPTLI